MQHSTGGLPISNSPAILLLDDEKDCLDMAEAMLSHDGIEADFCQTTAQAFDKIETLKSRGQQYDLVICDVMLKGESLSGVGFAEQIRESGYEGKVVFFTANHSDTLAIPAALLRVSEVWHKPEEVLNLVKNIRSLLKMTGAVPNTKSPSEKYAAKESLRDKFEWRIKSPPVMWLMLALLTISVGANCFTLYRSIYTAGAMRDIQAYVNQQKPGNVAGYPATIPNIASQGKTMKSTGNTRYTFEFEKGKVPVVEAGKAYRVQITEVR